MSDRLTGPLVTIVTPSLNQGSFLRAAIESVLGQDYPHIEYIVMDGGSSDNSAEIAHEYQSRLYWFSEPDRGQSHAINKGFRMAKGEIVAWLNSDDLLLEGAVTNAVRALEAHPLAGAIYGEGYLITEAGHILERFPYTQPFDLWRLTHLSDYILQPSVFFRKSALESVGYLREDLNYSMDWDLLIRIAKRFPLVAVPEFLSCLRQHSNTKTSGGGTRRIREIRAMLQEHTGRRFPLGWMVYGLETYLSIWNDLIARWMPRPLSLPGRLLAYALGAGASWAVDRAVRDSQGWYPDNYAGPLVRQMLSAGCGAFRIRGELPRSGWLAGQSIEVRIAGKNAGIYRPASGEAFSLEVEVPAALHDRPLEVELRASHYMVPSSSSGSANSRRISYILDGIDWIPAQKPRAPEPMINHTATQAC